MAENELGENAKLEELRVDAEQKTHEAEQGDAAAHAAHCKANEYERSEAKQKYDEFFESLFDWFVEVESQEIPLTAT